MTLKDKLLAAACKAAGCSTTQAKGLCRKQKLMYARMAFFFLGTQQGLSPHEMILYLKRSDAMAYYYRNAVDFMLDYDKKFKTITNKAQRNYEKSIQQPIGA